MENKIAIFGQVIGGGGYTAIKRQRRSKGWRDLQWGYGSKDGYSGRREGGRDFTVEGFIASAPPPLISLLQISGGGG